MYLTSAEITNIRSVRKLRWEVDGKGAPGWHVVLGNNGAGKSSFLRSVALALVGPEDIYGLRQSGDDWLRKGELEGSINIVFTRDPAFDRLTGVGAPHREYGAFVRLVREGTGVTIGVDLDRATRATDRSIWAPGAKGWFSAGFGPFRRFTGGDGDSRKMTQSLPRLARYLSLFDEQFALLDALEWLATLKLAALADGSKTFDRLRSFLNQDGFLPHGVRLDDVYAQPREVRFVDAADARVAVQELSDGFRSILSLTLELLRQLVLVYGEDTVLSGSPSIDVPGVVLIDEVDAHLHPTWQRTIGQWFVRAFPRVQFIVTTHSPLVCQSAEQGSAFWLPDLGSSDDGRFLTEAERSRLVYGNVLDAYGTGAFGTGVAQSDLGKSKLTRLAELNTKELEDALSPDEQAERQTLREFLPSRASVVRTVGG